VSGAASGKSESASGRAAGVDVLTSREEASKLEASSTRYKNTFSSFPVISSCVDGFMPS